MYPEHYDRGWHITGSTGTLGAAAACARLLGLDVERTQMALGIAASQPVGLREQFGSMTKPLHPGAAARAGLMSALMARHGYTASPRALEAPRGLMQVVSTKHDWREITEELGQRFEISFNAYKPFACGIVVHPGIDACAQLRARGVKPEDVEQVQHLPRLRRGPDVRPCWRGRVRRRRGDQPGDGGPAAQGGGHGGRRHCRRAGRRDGRVA
jgi:2-methylcitrate dehydratase PrpD